MYLDSILRTVLIENQHGATGGSVSDPRGYCYNCGKKGHPSSICREETNFMRLEAEKWRDAAIQGKGFIKVDSDTKEVKFGYPDGGSCNLNTSFPGTATFTRPDGKIKTADRYLFILPKDPTVPVILKEKEMAGNKVSVNKSLSSLT